MSFFDYATDTDLFVAAFKRNNSLAELVADLSDEDRETLLSWQEDITSLEHRSFPLRMLCAQYAHDEYMKEAHQNTCKSLRCFSNYLDSVAWYALSMAVDEVLSNLEDEDNEDEDNED